MVFQEDAFRRLSSLTTSACGFAASALFAVPWVRALAARRRRLFLSFFETPIDPRLQGKYKMGGQLKECCQVGGALANEYRKKIISDTWHFCTNCSQWPTHSYISSEQLPRGQTICNECIVKNQHGDCK